MDAHAEWSKALHQHRGIALRWRDQKISFPELIEMARERAQQIQAQKGSVVISVENRFESVLWMVTCSLHRIPYLPIAQWNPIRYEKSLELLQPAFVINRNKVETLSQAPRPRDACYFISTSGSTGTPKLISISWGNLMSYLKNVEPIFNWKSGRRVSQAYALTFDPALGEFYFGLWKGAELDLFDDHDPKAIPSYFENLESWANSPARSSEIFRSLQKPYPNVTEVSFCGERVTQGLVERTQELFPNAKIINFYGPAECTVSMTADVVEPNKTPSYRHGIMSIGKIYPSQKMLVHEGELCLAGDQVMDGYIGTPTPFLEHQGNRYYRTGDEVEVTPDGQIFFVGRIDDQIKLRGERVQASEIESYLNSIVPGRWVVGAGKIDGLGYAQNTFAVFEGSLPLAESKIRSELLAITSAIFVPARIFTVEKFPLSTNGKVDRKALLQIFRDQVN